MNICSYFKNHAYKRKIFFYLSVLLITTAVLILSSCSDNIRERSVRIEIPIHPWEIYSDCRLWYTLKWSDSSKKTENLRSMYVSHVERNISLNIPLGETVFILAYPLGDAEPFGCAITPLDKKNYYTLSQNTGVLLNSLLIADKETRATINPNLLTKICNETTRDYRLIDKPSLVKNISNGTLKKSSIKLSPTYTIEELPVLNGTWISQNELDPVLTIENQKLPTLSLAPGVYRYYCSEQDREFRITIDLDGNVNSVLKQALIPK